MKPGCFVFLIRIGALLWFKNTQWPISWNFAKYYLVMELFPNWLYASTLNIYFQTNKAWKVQTTKKKVLGKKSGVFIIFGLLEIFLNELHKKHQLWRYQGHWSRIFNYWSKLKLTDEHGQGLFIIRVDDMSIYYNSSSIFASIFKIPLKVPNS